jgi:hypothetical protein
MDLIEASAERDMLAQQLQVLRQELQALQQAPMPQLWVPRSHLLPASGTRTSWTLWR